MSDSDGRLFSFSDPKSGCSVVFEDNGRVAYAYLLDPSGAVLNDVWLYNRCETPETPEWGTPDKIPFANPLGFARVQENLSLVDQVSEIRIDWEAGENGRPMAFIFIRNELWAAVTDSPKPGWCALAVKDGPLARMMTSFPVKPIA